MSPQPPNMPPLDVLASYAAERLEVLASQVSVTCHYDDLRQRTIVRLRYGLLSREYVVRDVQVRGAADQAQWYWVNAVREADDAIRAKIAETKPAPIAHGHLSSPGWHAPYTSIASAGSVYGYGCYYETHNHTFFWDDPVRNTAGQIVGVMTGNGDIAAVDASVSAEVERIERDGVPVEPETIRRAIDLSGKLKR